MTTMILINQLAGEQNRSVAVGIDQIVRIDFEFPINESESEGVRIQLPGEISESHFGKSSIQRHYIYCSGEQAAEIKHFFSKRDELTDRVVRQTSDLTIIDLRRTNSNSISEQE